MTAMDGIAGPEYMVCSGEPDTGISRPRLRIYSDIELFMIDVLDNLSG
jgi:hypothetical protein